MALFAILVSFTIFIAPVFTSKGTQDNYKHQCKSISALGGSIPPTYCSFNKNGSLNTDIIPSYVTYLVQQGVTTAIVNHPEFGCDRLSAKERKKNLYQWMKASKSCGLTIIAYTSGFSIPDVIEESVYAKRHGAAAIMIGTDYFYRYNITFLRVEFVKEVASSVNPTPVIVDCETKRREGSDANVAKFHIIATDAIPNYWGVRASAFDCMTVIAETNLTRCQGLMTYDSLIFAPIDSTYVSPMASYASSIFIKEVADVYNSIVHNNTTSKPISLLLQVVKKFGVILIYLNIDNYNWGSSVYIEPAMREAFICVTNIDVGHSRHPSVYSTFSNLREDLRSSFRRSGIYCRA